MFIFLEPVKQIKEWQILRSYKIVWPCIMKFLIIQPTKCTNFSNLFLEWNSTCFGQFPCPSSGVFHSTHSNGMCHTVLQTASEQDEDSIRILLASCLQNCMTHTVAVCRVKNSLWWERNCAKHVEFDSKNKFEKLVHLVGFIIRIKSNNRPLIPLSKCT